jgi:regulator of sirC expression with transglutaminase-like and TPR domain
MIIMARNHSADGAPPCRIAFAQAVSRSDALINLAEAALLIAQEEYPTLEVRTYLRRLDAMAEAVRGRIGDPQDPREVCSRLNEHLFRHEGFRGNTENYYDPRNSFLNEVLDRRTGIPITLSIVYLELAWRLGLPLLGVGMPGHFLVKCSDASGEIVIDPFGGGAILSPADCQRILDPLFDGRVTFKPRMLAPVSNRQILMRILNNLKGIYVKADQYGKALAAADRLLILRPDSPCDLRDRGLLAFQLKRYDDASADLDRYLRLVPEAEDHDVIRDHLRSIRERVVALN